MADLGKEAGAITINVGVSISDETVELCLRVIEYWLNQNPDKKITGGYRNANGKIDRLMIVSRETNESEV